MVTEPPIVTDIKEGVIFRNSRQTYREAEWLDQCQTQPKNTTKIKYFYFKNGGKKKVIQTEFQTRLIIDLRQQEKPLAGVEYANLYLETIIGVKD